MCGRSSLWKHNFVYQTGGASSSLGEQGYDPETGTLTYLLSLSMYGTDKSLLEQPLTLLVAPPTIIVDGVEKPLADHPALITFQPEYTAVARSGEVRGENTPKALRRVMKLSGLYQLAKFDQEEIDV